MCGGREHQGALQDSVRLNVQISGLSRLFRGGWDYCVLKKFYECWAERRLDLTCRKMRFGWEGGRMVSTDGISSPMNALKGRSGTYERGEAGHYGEGNWGGN